MGLLNPGGPIAQFKRNRCSISPVELILQSGVRNTLSPIQQALLVKLRQPLKGEELQVMNSILAQFALYWEYR